ncbi:hypothetical protein SDRG_14704 [Saprolegnia diclina VS20]|uniref:Telomere length regulation protein conserved domain-containing protein n=1 Tax=Saprolegnia diclina (strain VS20) TaxID=1156394 RepID=T0RD65_SAPDV|nr:hypothetical protein SDRG_14704 [Saprolegnia diclina VS20]EQC27502.1 hypothetical protein SDRG_14704 [Saprolegnia diclina VS20]|eukprot:XP_008619076.1 hypothetical protein SDRG_14704 [Saprolegnia diclina VS20]
MSTRTLEGWADGLRAAEAAYDIDEAVRLLVEDNDLLADNYKAMATHVLEAVVPAWVTTTVADAAALAIVPAVDSLLSVATAETWRHVQSLFLALYDIVSRRQLQAQSHDMALRLLQRFLDDDGLYRLQSEMMMMTPKATSVADESLVAKLCALPAIVCNLDWPQTQRGFLPSTFFPRLVLAFVRHRGAVSSGHLGALLVPKLVRLGHAKCVASVWLANCTSPSEHYIWLNMLPPSAYEGLFSETVKFATNDTSMPVDWATLLPTSIVEQSVFQHVLSHKLLLHAKTALPFAAIDAAVRVLSGPTTPAIHYDDAAQSPLVQVLDKLIQAWAFGCATDADVDGSAAMFIELGLDHLSTRYVDARAVVETRRWIGPLSMGIRERMGHSLQGTRQWGMVVAIALSKVLTPETPLTFEDEDLPRHGTAPATTTPLEPLVASALKKPSRVDPDAIVDSDDDDAAESTEGDVNDAASDISLEPYELSDDEDEAVDATPPMVYLLDVLEGLQQDGDRDRAELALRSLPALIHRRPYDLHDLAVTLCRAVTRLDDTFQTPHFDALRKASLRGLVLEAPAQALPTLAAQVFDSEKLFQVKLDILSTLALAAPNVRVDKANTLSLFFYPLLLPLQTQLANAASSMHSLDHVLMAHVFQTLAAVLETSGQHGPRTIAMATAFLELIWSQRTHELPSVRRQVLFGLSRVLLVLPGFAWSEQVARLGLQTSLVPYLDQLRQWDPDHGCRSAAGLLLTTVDTGAFLQEQ